MSENNKDNGVLETVSDSDGEMHSYHGPTFVSYGSLTELVQIHPAVQSDGGVNDCQHF